MTQDNIGGGQSVDRALAILNVLVEEAADCSLAEVVRQVQLPTTTVHRLLGALIRTGFVVQNANTSRYTLGPQLILIGQRAIRKNELIRIARPWLESLATSTGETVNLTTRVGDDVMQLDHVESRNMLRVTYPEGERFPMHASASGKLFLARLPERERERILASVLQPYTSGTLIRRSALEADLASIRERGYALDDAEREAGVRCVAAPIANDRGEFVAAVSISGPALRISVGRLHDLAGEVRQAAEAIAAEWNTASPRTTAARRLSTIDDDLPQRVYAG
jgi:IclR family transcriptional regulator, acetate operon repressor